MSAVPAAAAGTRLVRVAALEDVPPGWVLKVAIVRAGAKREIALANSGGTVFALENACTHAGGPLYEGEVQDGVVTCPWHGSRFRLSDGAVCRAPATFPVPRLETRVRGGRVEVRGRQG